MLVNATISSVWVRRMVMLGAFLFGIGGWFFFDGLIWWPEINRRWTAHEELKTAGREADWPKMAEENGWPVEPPEKMYRQDQLVGQFVLGSTALLAGFWVLAWFLMCRKRTVKFDGKTIVGDTGKSVALEEVVDMDLKKWDSKGIAVAIYERQNSKGKLVIDDYKYEGAIEIVRAVRKHLISSGRWEEEPEAGSEEIPSETKSDS